MLSRVCPPNPKIEANMLQHGPFALLPLLALTLTTSSQSAVSWGRLVTTYWDPYLSILINAGAGRAKGRLHFFPITIACFSGQWKWF